jgi:predicted PurR-regulated permease PerM
MRDAPKSELIGKPTALRLFSPSCSWHLLKVFVRWSFLAQDVPAKMQTSNPKREHPKKVDAPHLDSDAVSPLDAWGWAERISVIGLFTIAVLYVLFAMQGIFVPVVAAWVMGAILRPVVERAEKHRVPRGLAVVTTALVALLILLAIIGLLSTPLTYWISHTKELASLIREKLELLGQPLSIFDEIGHTLSDISGAPASAPTASYDTSTIISAIISTLTPVVTQFMLFFFAMIFWMLYANDIKAGIAYLFSGDRGQIARAVLDEAESNVSQYFGTLAVVNLVLAALAAGLAWAVGLPNPLLWGVLAGMLNFIPYLGPAVTVATFFVVGLMTFPSLKLALIPPLIWIVVNTLEGSFITPMLVGHRHTLNPFLVFLSIAFWSWLWGPMRALLATPLLISAYVLQRHLSSYSTTSAS